MPVSGESAFYSSGAAASPDTNKAGSIMIEEPPRLTIARAIERPDALLVERFAGAPTRFIVDAMGGGGALDWRIKPIVGTSVIGMGAGLGAARAGPVDGMMGIM